MAERFAKGSLQGLTRAEIIDSFSASRVGRALDPLAHLLRRSGAISSGHESARVLALAFAYAHSEEIPGDYAEFGVWQGRTFVEAWRIGTKLSRDRRYFAFDSFEGLPETEGIDDTGRWEASEFSFARQSFEARLRRAKVPAAEVEIVEGFYDATLAPGNSIPLEKVAIAWVDCDLYSSTVPVLEFLEPRLSQGAIVLFDDWFCFKGDPDKGEAKATAEWLEQNPGITLVPWRQFNWAGQAFILRRADGVAPAAPQDETAAGG
ncbi:MAG TPA: TylF/MycF/NovP-related O-methyltransferase [Solirubrobacterales bacterium]